MNRSCASFIRAIPQRRSMGGGKRLLSLFALTVLPLFLAACPTDGTMSGGADLRPIPDLRTSPGNPLIGVACDDKNLCPLDNKGARPRCAILFEGDRVGVCAPKCTTDADCDTTLPGKAFCSDMPMQGAPTTSECVLFCGTKNKECPQNWTCQSVQTYFLCRPPQVSPVSDMSVSPADMR